MMQGRRTIWLFAMAALATFTGPAPAPAASKTTIKMATLVPEGTVWHKTLTDLGASWTRETEGRVALRLYAGGVAGDEPVMVRKMRIGQLNGSVLTVLGLADLDDSFLAFTVPMLFESYDELLYVLDKMEPVLKKRLEAKGFVLLNWGHAGWLYLFSREPVASVADLKKQKLWWRAGDEGMVKIWKESGFQPVPLSMTDIMTGLQTGMIDMIPLTPLGVLALQWFRLTPYMVDAGLAPLVGGVVISRATWEKISEADRAKMLAAARGAEAKLQREIPEQDEQALEEMKKRGLKVSKMTPESEAEWRAMAASFAGKMRGAVVPPEILDQVIRERDAYRQQHAKH
jgi:TRAP-type C4-dicarboxylate transport system substrate-binding protein